MFSPQNFTCDIIDEHKKSVKKRKFNSILKHRFKSVKQFDYPLLKSRWDFHSPGFSHSRCSTSLAPLGGGQCHSFTRLKGAMIHSYRILSLF